MPKSLAFFIGSRYTRAKRRNHFISFISFASMAGIALGVIALVTVLSVMNGFDSEIRSRILTMTPHVTVLGWGEPVKNWQALKQQVEKNPSVQGAMPFVEGQVMLSANGFTKGALIKGVDQAQVDTIYPISDKMITGELQNLENENFGIVLGDTLAKNMQLQLGDKVTVIAPEANFTPAGIAPRLKQFKLVGTFKVGYVYDSSFAFTNLQGAAKLLRLDGVSGLEVKLDNYLAAPRITKELYNSLANNIFVTNWTKQNANYFQAVKMEKTLMFLILLLIVAVAAFNLVATLVMVVNDKNSDIAILRTFGASPRMIMKIFMYQGAIVGFIGTFLGIVLGCLLAVNVTKIVATVQSFFEVQFLSSDVYFISFLPSKLEWQDVALVATISFLLSLLATIYPALSAAKVNPAEALRYE